MRCDSTQLYRSKKILVIAFHYHALQCVPSLSDIEYITAHCENLKKDVKEIIMLPKD